MQGDKCKDEGTTHQSGTVPPLWTFCHRVARTAGRAPLLCPPGNTAAASVKIIPTKTEPTRRYCTHTRANFWMLLGYECVSFSLLIYHNEMRPGVMRQHCSEKLFISNSYPKRRRPCESSHNNRAHIEHNKRDESNVEPVKHQSF